MNFILRGLLTLKAKFGRTLILLCIMFVISAFDLSSFGIQSATDAAAILARQKLGAEVTLSQDMEKLMQAQREEMSNSQSEANPTEGKGGRFNITREPVPTEYIDELATNEHVIGYLIANSTTANLSDLEAVGATESTTESNTETSTSEKGNMGGMKPSMNMGDVTLSGVNEFKLSSEYVNGEASLLSGRELSETDLNSNVVMVEENFATANSLEVGSKFSILNSSDENSVELEVVGIYKSYSTIDDNGFRNTAMSPYNKFYVPYTLVNTIKGEDTTGVDSVIFYLDDPANVDAFVEFGNTTSIDFDKYTLDAGTREYESMMQPIENVASFSKITILIVAIFGGAILALIIMLSIKDRINEIGILMSLGEKRIKVIGQFIVEVLVVLVFALGISVLAGNTISNKIGDVLLANELETESQATDNSMSMGGKPSGGNRPSMGGSGFGVATVEKIEELNVDISFSDISKMAVISILIAIIGTILPSLMIMRYNPKQILSKHN